MGTLICEQFLQEPTWTNGSQDQQHKITLKIEVPSILNVTLIWPKQICAALGRVLGGLGQGYNYLLLNGYKIYLFSKRFHRMPFCTDQKF